MSEHDALLHAICANPRDDLPRLVYADWLDDHADRARSPEVARLRAEFIRTDVAMARLPAWDPTRRRHEAGLDAQSVFQKPWARAVLDGLPHGFRWFGTPGVRRGFPWSVAVSHPSDLFDRRSRVLARYPVERLVFDLSPPDLPRLAAAPWLARLSGLILRTGNFGSAAITALGDSPHAAGLEELGLWSRAVSPAGLAAVLNSPLFAALRVLSISDHPGPVMRVLFDGLSRDHPGARLRRLDLRGAMVGDDGFRALAESPAVARLEELELGSTRVNAERAQLLAASPAVAGLRALSLFGNPLGNAGAAALAASPHLGELRVLDLSYCQVGDDGVRALLESPPADRLMFLNLTGSPASDEMKQELKARMGDHIRV